MDELSTLRPALCRRVRPRTGEGDNTRLLGSTVLAIRIDQEVDAGERPSASQQFVSSAGMEADGGQLESLTTM